MIYQPQPINSGSISLPAELIELTERLAENAHDVWAAQRLAQGWTYGPRRDDAAKQHPDLVPYGDLPESEKEYDRKTAMETLKAIVGVHFPGIKEHLLTTALTEFFQVRETPGLKKKPSTSEVLDWLKLILAEDLSPEDLRRDTMRPIRPLHGFLA